MPTSRQRRAARRDAERRQNRRQERRRYAAQQGRVNSQAIPSYVRVPVSLRQGIELQTTLPGCGLGPAVQTTRLPSDPRVEGVDFHVCSECSVEMEPGVTEVSADNSNFCERCYCRDFTHCSVCSREVPVGQDFYSTNSEIPFCEGCYMTAHANCQACGNETASAELRDAPDSARLCVSCYNARFVDCCGCGRVIAFDAVAYVDEYDADSYCCDCAPNNEDDDEAEWEQGRRVDGQIFDKVGSRRKFGVELEISSCAKHAGLRGKTPFGVKYDGSLSSGKEFVSPILQGDEGLEAIENLCAYGKENDWTVDSSCGYHVHVDCGDLDDEQLKSIAVGYALTADLWGRFVTKKRQSNRYCKSLPYAPGDLRHQSFRELLDSTEDRYYWLNWQAYSRHKTVEIRLHSGTTNADKVINWVKIHTRFVDALAAMPESEVWATFEGKSLEQQFDALMRLAGDAKLRRYYKRRAEKHGRPITPVAAPAEALTDMELAS